MSPARSCIQCCPTASEQNYCVTSHHLAKLMAMTVSSTFAGTMAGEQLAACALCWEGHAGWATCSSSRCSTAFLWRTRHQALCLAWIAAEGTCFRLAKGIYQSTHPASNCIVGLECCGLHSSPRHYVVLPSQAVPMPRIKSEVSVASFLVCRLCIRPSPGDTPGLRPPCPPSCCCGHCRCCCAWCAAPVASAWLEPWHPAEAVGGGGTQLWQQLPGGATIMATRP